MTGFRGNQIAYGRVTAVSAAGLLTVDVESNTLSASSVAAVGSYASPAVGDRVILTGAGQTWIALAQVDAPAASAWTPTVNNGLTVGDGAWTGSQLSLVNGWCSFYLQFELGSTSSVGTDVRIAWPYTPRGSSRTANTFTGILEDDSGSDYVAHGYRFDSSAFRIVTLDSSNRADLIEATVPFTWATGTSSPSAVATRSTPRRAFSCAGSC